MAYFFQPSLGGLIVQAVGAFLLAALCIALLRTMHRPELRDWSVGWVTLCLSLQALYLATYYPALRLAGHAVYLFGEYVFGYMVIVGCRRFAGTKPPGRRELWLLAPAALWCIWIARVAGGNINLLFAVHTLVYPYLFYRALQTLRGVPRTPQTSVGLRVFQLALLLLTIDYLHYAPLFAAASYQGLRVFDAYLTYAPMYDLIFQVMLMFGMVMVTTGRAQQELEEANGDLKRARDRIEASSRMDPLTSALNRRAFDAVLADRARDGRGLVRGVVAVVDLDDLKLLNDRYGHAAGDAALVAVAEGLRACVEADDLLFRWGGDEFVLLLRDEAVASAEARLGALNSRLQRIVLPGTDVPVDLRASVGLAPFDGPPSLAAAIAQADRAMYRRKQSA